MPEETIKKTTETETGTGAAKVTVEPGKPEEKIKVEETTTTAPGQVSETVVKKD